MTDTPNKVEMVARALHENFRQRYVGADQTPWDQLEPLHREYGMSQARAAIAAMREPDVAMKLAADLFFDNTSRVFGLAEPVAAGKKIWQAMIDAALNGK